ncbi:ABC transporter ATP-binding protein [Papillibacter cinnamivorans]|uniref:Peptide/nickel transport system ATP-binding protein n=1 Tax=Papillibacter cinnamivorans DSM 12816 TaxID=1122930 RepID=A0A1W2BM53_9FIRM|nr:ABC transporter ATP-binding protein [Papillibacter cinnamivorans]SMC73628.1 peptide/nickel transport system ATP-binding protein [Papillibacter cinnamivorans DSM 12816]
MSGESMITVKDLRKVFKTKFGDLVAVDNINFEIRRGEIFGLVGESGSGKSTIGSMIVGTYPPTSGSITFQDGRDISKSYKFRSQELKREIQLVFQDPGGSLNPRKTIRQILSVPLQLFSDKHLSKSELDERLEKALLKVDLPTEYLDKYPRAIGGGEKQLVCIARALAADPSFIVLDEPTSALDVSIQAKITNKLIELQKENGISYLFITHNLCLVRNMCHRLAIMYLGNICEFAETAEFFERPLHPYTQMLLASIPVVSDEEEKLKPQKIHSVGEIPSPLNKPSGCSFHPRCPYKMDICAEKVPEMREITPGHFACCHML